MVTAGTAESMRNASHVKCCRHVHEITVAALHVLQQIAYKQYLDNFYSANGSDADASDFESWSAKQCS